MFPASLYRAHAARPKIKLVDVHHVEVFAHRVEPAANVGEWIVSRERQRMRIHSSMHALPGLTASGADLPQTGGLRSPLDGLMLAPVHLLPYGTSEACPACLLPVKVGHLWPPRFGGAPGSGNDGP